MNIDTFVGYEKGSEQPLEVEKQVLLLIAEATDPANLAQGKLFPKTLGVIC